MKLTIPPALWRGLVLILALCATTQLVIELLSSPRALTLGVAGQPLFSGSFDPVRGPTQFLVASVPSASPLAAAGVQPGDRVHYDEPHGRWLAREQALQRFVQQAGLASTPAALCAGFVNAVDDFSGGAGCTLFLPGDAGYAAAEKLATAVQIDRDRTAPDLP